MLWAEAVDRLPLWSEYRLHWKNHRRRDPNTRNHNTRDHNTKNQRKVDCSLLGDRNTDCGRDCGRHYCLVFRLLSVFQKRSVFSNQYFYTYYLIINIQTYVSVGNPFAIRKKPTVRTKSKTTLSSTQNWFQKIANLFTKLFFISIFLVIYYVYLFLWIHFLFSLKFLFIDTKKVNWILNEIIKSFKYIWKIDKIFKCYSDSHQIVDKFTNNSFDFWIPIMATINTLFLIIIVKILKLLFQMLIKCWNEITNSMHCLNQTLNRFESKFFQIYHILFQIRESFSVIKAIIWFKRHSISVISEWKLFQEND